ncbi:MULTISPECIES: hypothetical protein [Novosphingobium]|uniref:Uncharacterized protein n=1 Tax=Novosphingobium pentaromativorans TaxID=205844 RepID=A0A2W5Q740_9SPHN|nr:MULTISPECIES: hypothetical protein [Novosphingobium]PZQ53217.1 MAG: hypothetical protein DI555_17220 [Novosphingobium pentaromativorans]GFE73065.1 hypothetical protein NTCA1_07140 [Novosphingobium sp. TCA1]
MSERPDDRAPETVNPEQEDEDTQAQTFSEEAQGRASSGFGLEESEKVKGGIADEDDIEDLVDHMNQMDSSGVIDMSAYRGEETMDDLEDRYGKENAADEDFADDDS